MASDSERLEPLSHTFSWSPVPLSVDRSYEPQGCFLWDGWHPDPALCITQPAVTGRG